MKQVLFIHGGDGYSNRENFLQALQTQEIRNPKGEEVPRWSRTLRERLGADFELYQPTMPNKENAHYDEWKIWFERHLALVGEPVILVGWSLGGMFLLKYLAENEVAQEIKALFVLGTPAGHYDDGEGNDCGSFQFGLNALESVTQKVSEVHLLHSKDDFIVPYEHALALKDALSTAELHTFEDRNHFLQAEFPELVEWLKKVG